MGEKIGGFRTTGIWVLLRYGLGPLMALTIGAVIFIPSARHTVGTQLKGGMESTMSALSRVPGFSNAFAPGGATYAPPDSNAFQMAIGRPNVTADTPRVRLSDLPASTTPVSVKLVDLPEPVDPIVFQLDTRSSRRPPQVITSPRPRPIPPDGYVSAPAAEPLICRVWPRNCI